MLGRHGNAVFIRGKHLLPLLHDHEPGKRTHAIPVVHGVIEQRVLHPVRGLLQHVINGNQFHPLPGNSTNNVESNRLRLDTLVRIPHVRRHPEYPRLPRVRNRVIIGRLDIHVRPDRHLVRLVIIFSRHRNVQRLRNISPDIQRQDNCPRVSCPPPEIIGKNRQRRQLNGINKSGCRDFRNLPRHLDHHVIGSRTQELGHVKGHRGSTIHVYLFHGQIIRMIPVPHRYLQ